MQYSHYYVCFHVDQQGERGKALALEKSIDATKEVSSEGFFFVGRPCAHSIYNLLIKRTQNSLLYY